MPKSRPSSTRRKAPDYTIKGDIGGGPGASDGNSGGGNASGAPDADTAMRLGRAPGAGNAKEDKAKLFPERFSGEKARAGPTSTGATARGRKGAEVGAGTKSRTKAQSARPLKIHGDKFEDKIPSTTRAGSRAKTRAKRKSR